MSQNKKLIIQLQPCDQLVTCPGCAMYLQHPVDPGCRMHRYKIKGGVKDGVNAV